MTASREASARRRARTDTSLEIERASSVSAGDQAAELAQRRQDDLIERDRQIADDRLSRYRARADRELADERSAYPAGDRDAVLERAADDVKHAERTMTDGIHALERRRADELAMADREGHVDTRARQETERQDTDNRLSRERTSADATAIALDEARSALADARAQSARRGDVLGMVTHDLRSPLHVIMLNAELIAEDTEESDTREAAQEVSRAAARMARLLTDLLDVARIESGVFKITKQRHDVGTLLREVHDSYRPLFEARGMTLTITAPTELVASFDHDRIVQVLSNLLGNAMKFTPRGGTVELLVELRDQENEIVLRDSGPGIAPEALPHVFERFFQLDTDARRGLGLGLYICQKIIVAHGGRIWAESMFGHGATFRFTLPITP